MARVKTFTNGGTLVPGDLNAIEDDYEFAFSGYKTLLSKGGVVPSALAGGTYPLLTGPNVGLSSGLSVTGVGASQCAFYFDPADRTANTRVNKLRVRAWLATNTVAPAITFTVGLYPITFSFGASGSQTSVTPGTVVSGSTVPFATPGASSSPTGVTADFTAPAAGFYSLAVVLSGVTATNSIEAIRAELQYRQV